MKAKFFLLRSETLSATLTVLPARVLVTGLLFYASFPAAHGYGPGCPYTNAQPPVLTATNPLLHVSMKWCALAEAPMILNPNGVACRPTYKDALWQRHERASDLIWIPQAKITLRSGAAGIKTNFMTLADPDLAIGMPGDVVVVPDIDEAMTIFTTCDEKWNEGVAQPKGIIPVSVNRIINAQGNSVMAAFTLGPATVTRPYMLVADPTVFCPLNERAIAKAFGQLVGLVPSTNVGNLMQTGTNATGATLSSNQCVHARNFISVTNTALDPPANSSAPGNLVAMAFDPAGDAEQPYLDVQKIVAIDNSPTEGFLGFYLATGGVVPSNVASITYWIMLDVDNDPSTGATPSDLVPGTPMNGVEFVCRVRRQGATVTATLYSIGELGFFVQVPLAAGLVTGSLRQINYMVIEPTPAYTGPLEFPAFSEVDFKIAYAGLVPSGLAPGGVPPGGLFPNKLRIQAVATTPATTQFDFAPADCAILPFPRVSFPFISLPRNVAPGQTNTVTVDGMPPNATLKVMIGPTMLPVTPISDANGVAIFQITVPTNTPPGDTLITVGLMDGDNAITADGVTTVLPANLPSVAITSPANGAIFTNPASFSVTATASTPAGSIVNVRFFANNTLIGTDATAPYSAPANGLTLGNYVLTAVVSNSLGLASASAPVTVSVASAPQPGTLVATGSFWKYYHSAFPDPNWRSPMYDDSDTNSWPSGPTQFGFGDGDEATMPNFTSLNGYFLRRSFPVANPGSISSLTLRVLRDDGVAVYLNGVEVFSNNLPPNRPVDPFAQATTSVTGAAENSFLQAALNPALLVSGMNVLAVEVHQFGDGENDLSFDLELSGPGGSGQVPPNFLAQPASLTVNESIPAVFSIGVTGSPPVAVQWYRDGALLAGETNRLLVTAPTTVRDNGATFFAVINNSHGTATSQSATLTVRHPANQTLADSFLQRGVLSGTTNSANGNNAGFTSEAGEPVHAVGTATRSAWISWTAPAGGNVTMSTTGSTFNTVLAVYTGNVVSNLTLVASNDNDPQGGQHSRVTFSAVAGTAYQIAIAGVSAASGSIVFSLSLGGSPPVITSQPVSQMATAGPTTTIFFNITATGTPPLQYQWFKGTQPIPEATLDRLRIDCVSETDGGSYFCRVRNPFGVVDSGLGRLIVGPATAPTGHYCDTNTVPPCGQYVSKEEFHVAYSNGIVITNARHRFFTDTAPPPPAPLTETTHRFGSLGSFGVSMNGGASYQYVDVNATAQTRVRHVRDQGDVQIFETEMQELTFSGGGMPPGVRIRIDPDKTSAGGMTIQPFGSGFLINSFFDLCTQVSTDNGATWVPALAPLRVELQRQPPEDIFSSPNLPPYNGRYASPHDYHVAYANGVVLSDLSHRAFTTNQPPPALGAMQEHAFDSMAEFRFSTNGGQSFIPASAPASVHVRLHYTGNQGSNMVIETEMLMLDIRGGTLPPGVRLRLSPAKPATGKTTVEPVGGGHRISSYFDLCPELSVDDGQNWMASLNPVRVELERVAPEQFSTDGGLPPRDGYYVSPADYHLAYAMGVVLSDVRHRAFTGNSPPPPPGGSQMHSFGSLVDFNVSLNGGQSFSSVTATAGVSVLVKRLADFGNTQRFETEMRTLDIAGGGLPPSIRVRLDTNRPAPGETTIRPVPGGLRVASHFTIWPDLSTNGGVSWTPANRPVRVELNRTAPESFFGSDALPPTNGIYVGPAQYHLAYANGIVLQDVRHRAFTQNSPPPASGASQLHTFGSVVDFKVSIDGGATFQNGTATANTRVQVRHRGDLGNEALFQTEMLQLDISGGTLPPGVRIREHPARISEGATSIRPVPGGHHIASAFDIATQLSVDDGQTWSDALDPARVELVLVPRLSIALNGGNAVISHPVCPCVLQRANSVLGPWVDLSNLPSVVEPAQGNQFFRVVLNQNAGWDFDGDGQDDLIRSPSGLAYDVGGGMFVELPPAKGWVVKVTPTGFEVDLDTDGDGVTDTFYELRDVNGDGHFSGPGEVLRIF